MKKLEEAKKIIFCDYKSHEVTESSVKDISMYPHLYRGSVKTSTGAVYTDKEYDDFRETVYKISLP